MSTIKAEKLRARILIPFSAVLVLIIGGFLIAIYQLQRNIIHDSVLNSTTTL